MSWDTQAVSDPVFFITSVGRGRFCTQFLKMEPGQSGEQRTLSNTATLTFCLSPHQGSGWHSQTSPITTSGASPWQRSTVMSMSQVGGPEPLRIP